VSWEIRRGDCIPGMAELEGLMVENVAAKEAQFEADVEQAQRNYVKAVHP
jgi:hypothetical protein